MATIDPNRTEYWHAIIGPVKRKELPWGADFPMRMAVKDKFHEFMGRPDDVCASGWGTTKEQKDAMLFANNTDETKESIINSYYYEKKPLPRHVKAWELLLKYEKRNGKVRNNRSRKH